MYYRLQPEIAGEFSAENAYSSLMGGEDEVLTAATMVCACCSGTADENAVASCEVDHEWLRHDDGNDAYCRECEWCGGCEGTGAMDRDRGYSCYENASEMVASNLYRCTASDGSAGILYEFDGRCVGTGPDGEPLVVPSGEVRVITWDELDVLAAEEAAVHNFTVDLQYRMGRSMGVGMGW